MMRYFLFFTLFLFVFNGCSTSESNLSPKITQTTQETKDTTALEQKSKIQNIETDMQDDSDTLDGFEDEFNDDSTQPDPLVEYNRFMTSFNDLAYTYLLDPTAKVYAAIIPELLRIGISNAHHNLRFPIRFVNNLLQLKFQNATTELERFIVNSTVGIVGLMDPAKEYMHLDIHEEDFGQTLGYYSVGTGFHIVLPLLGPSNLRDSLGLGIDTYISPLTNLEDSTFKYKIPNTDTETILIYGGYVVNKNSLHLGEYESAKKDALDLYIFLRDIYEQKRASEVAE